MNNGSVSGDFAAFSDPAIGGFIASQATTNVAFGNHLYRIDDVSPYTPTQITSSALGGVLDLGLVHQIEADRNNRIFFCMHTTFATPIPLFSRYGCSSLPDPSPDIFYFDYAGTPVSALTGTINTSGRGTHRHRPRSQGGRADDRQRPRAAQISGGFRLCRRHDRAVSP